MRNRKQKISEKRKVLLLKLESMIGDSCYNDFIKNYGPGGKLESEGRWFRYPIIFVDKHGKPLKTRSPRADKITDNMLRNGFYPFGANHLHIMKALANILDYLEKQYDLSFDK